MIRSKAAKLDVEKLRQWIGREEQVSDVITTDLIRKFYATFDLEGPVPEMGRAVPRLIHFCLAQATTLTAALGTDGHPRKGHFLPPVPLPRRMWAAGRLNFRRDLRVGDSVRRVSRIADVVPKNGRAGLSAHPHLRRITVETSTEPVSYPAPAPIFVGVARNYGAVPDLGQHRESP